jgi:anti-anti-sigma regulatory factor
MSFRRLSGPKIVGTSSLATVDALARLQLAARRRGLELRLHAVSRELRELIELAGLTAVLGVESRRKAEEGEERVRVEEERDLGDAAC